MFRRATGVLFLVKITNVLVKTELKNSRLYSDIFKGGKGGGIDSYHVKLLEVNKGKEARIMQLTSQIEALQAKIKAMRQLKSEESKSALAEMEVILKDLKDALRKLRMQN